MSVTDVHECFTLYVDELPVTVDIVVYGVYESNYGADADGNRGINAWFVEDYEYTIPDASDDGTPLETIQKEKLKLIIQDLAGSITPPVVMLFPKLLVMLPII